MFHYQQAIPASCGLAGTGIRTSTRLVMSKTENKMPAIARARRRQPFLDKNGILIHLHPAFSTLWLQHFAFFRMPC